MCSLQLKSCGKKSKITSFNDPTICNSRAIIDLVDCLKPGSIKYDHVKEGESSEVGYNRMVTVINFR